MGLIVGLLGGVIMASIMIKPNQRGKRKSNLSGNFGGMLEGGLYLFGFLALLFLGLSILAFIRPLTHPADKIQYQQESQFAYSATGTRSMIRRSSALANLFSEIDLFLNIAFTYSARQSLQEYRNINLSHVY
jgi:hypothetical protein